MTVQILDAKNLESIALWEDYNLPLPRIGERVAIRGIVLNTYYRVVDVIFHNSFVELRVEEY